MDNSREAAAADGLAVLGVEVFRAFVRSIRADASCIAVRLCNEALDSGRSTAEIFFTGEEFGFQLQVARLSEFRFTVEFGCLAGPLAGDGGEWDVIVDRTGAIVRAVQRGKWIS